MGFDGLKCKQNEGAKCEIGECGDGNNGSNEEIFPFIYEIRNSFHPAILYHCNLVTRKISRTFCIYLTSEIQKGVHSTIKKKMISFRL